ncbi:MAG: SDR family oxidoreductase [Clostridia bacterium]|nr:SDR family oxidoreductase [Clostridia bacterium]
MKLVLITGASRGIGAETARVFAQNGYMVAANYKKSHSEAAILKSSFSNIETFCADVSRSDDVDKMFDGIKKHFGKFPDILINNAGISHSGLLNDDTEEIYNNIFDVNMKSVFLCSKKASESMIREKKGKIINIASVWGQTGASCEVLYSASKAAVIGFTKAFAKEVGPSGITVNCISPGVIKTDMLSCYSDDVLSQLADETPVSRLGTPRDIANTALFLASENADFITGQTIGVNGGFLI